MCIALILLVPLIAMQFTTQVHWSVLDFIVAGTLLLIGGLILELILKKVAKKQNRTVLVLILIISLLLIWAELAIGLFGSPFAGN
ncbi:hypothetical protein ACFSSB_07535 [Lacinutrix gracilariae]|uniref:Uncharacterized protein n=1 Tax=Lacinutrix gracilariae TaxID=1747198 RepID=A0ABW5K2N1_9FLAO